MLLPPHLGPSSLPSPAKIRSLYRILLRHAGAAVLFSKPEMPNLRALYRPELDIWMKKAQTSEQKMVADQHEWREFARRAQNTLDLLHRSATKADSAAQLTRNLSHLRYHLDPPLKVEANKKTKSLRTARTDVVQIKPSKLQSEVDKRNAWDALAQVVGMAEATSGLFLGKVRRREPLEND